MEKGWGENAGGAAGCLLTLMNNNVGSVQLLCGGAYTLIDWIIRELYNIDMVPKNRYTRLIVHKLHASRGNGWR